MNTSKSGIWWNNQPQKRLSGCRKHYPCSKMY